MTLLMQSKARNSTTRPVSRAPSFGIAFEAGECRAPPVHDCVFIHSHNHTIANDAGYLLYKSDNCCSPRAMRAGVCPTNRCSDRVR